MAENELTDSATTPIDLEVKTELSEPDTSSPDVSSPDFIPLHTTSKPKHLKINNSMPNENNGNSIEKNGQKRIQTTPIDEDDGTSKKPRMNTPEDSNIKIEMVGMDETDNIKNVGGNQTNFKNEPNKNVTDLDKKAGGDKIILQIKDDRIEDVEEMDQSSDTEEYYMTVHNLPTEWTYLQIKNYLDQQIGHVDEMEMLKHRKSKSCAIRLTFQSIQKCTDVYKKLENKFVNDKKLKVKISGTYTTFPTGVTIPNSIEDNMITQTNETSRRWRPDLDSFDIDPDGLYGLRPEFLKALDIKPPLSKLVHVTNFRCDRVELKEVMEMAGNVLMCCVIATVTKHAKVLYSHPLEAVQAISMLNGQLFYGIPLKISMDKNPVDCVVLPKGLANIGQGLGTKARPIRNIAQQYHRYANKQLSSINPIIFSEIDFSHDNINKIETEENSEEIEEKINAFLSSRPGCNILNPTVHLKMQNIDELECPDSMEASDSVLELAKNKSSGKTKSVGSPQDQAKKGSDKQQSNSPRSSPAAAAAPAFGAIAPNTIARLGNPSGLGYMHPNIMMNPPIRNPAPIPGPREPFFRSGNPQDPRPFRPRVPFIPPPMQRPPFAPLRPPFGPPAGMRPPVPPAGMGPPVPPVGMRFQVPPGNFNGPRANIGNCVTVKFSNLPPSTTFPLLCDQLAQCGQVMSVQLTTPGCAVATFGHPSHAETCFQSFNGMNVEGYIIGVSFA